MTKKIIHLSDLHFGTEENGIVNKLESALSGIAADLVIISGDFTQIGSEKEFRRAQEFLHNLPCDYICVPGNHDVPARNLYERFFEPYKKYKEFISDDLCPVYQDQDVVICGLNSARRALPHWNWANGAISQPQIARLNYVFKPKEKRWTICTFHHPVHKIDDMPLDVTVFGRKKVMQALQDLKVDLVLTGHVHHASITTRGDETHQSVYVSASTALSSRKRGHENGFNVITLNDNHMMIEVMVLEGSEFKCHQHFDRKRI